MEKMPTTPKYVAAAILDPNQKDKLSELNLEEDEINAGFDYILSHEDLVQSSSISLSPPRFYENDFKRMKFDEFQMKDNNDNELTEKQTIEQELCEYRNLKVLDRSQSILDFWKRRSGQFPHLSLVARKVLGQTASSSKPENDFSDCGETKTTERSRLQPFRLDDIITLSGNFDLLDI